MKTKNIEQMKVVTQQHIEADAVMQGDYWQQDSNDVGGRGCFIGCLTHGRNAKDIESKFGMPLMLVHLAESIFERLESEDAKKFFEDIPEAIGKNGKDLSLVAWKFLASELRAIPQVDSDTSELIGRVIAGVDSLAAGGEYPEAAADARAASQSGVDGYLAVGVYAALHSVACAARCVISLNDKYVAIYAADAAAAFSEVAVCAVYAAGPVGAGIDVDGGERRQAETLLRLIAAAT